MPVSPQIAKVRARGAKLSSTPLRSRVRVMPSFSKRVFAQASAFFSRDETKTRNLTDVRRSASAIACASSSNPRRLMNFVSSSTNCRWRLPRRNFHHTAEIHHLHPNSNYHHRPLRSPARTTRDSTEQFAQKATQSFVHCDYRRRHLPDRAELQKTIKPKTTQRMSTRAQPCIKNEVSR